MARGADQWAVFTKELSYGVYDTLAGTVLYPRLMDGAALALDPDPKTQEERGADGGNLAQMLYGTRVSYGGSFKCLLRPDQAVNLVNWGFNPTSGVLDSWTIDWFDGVEARRWLGCRVAQGTLSSDNQSDALTLSYSLVAQKIDGTFTTLAQPASSVYPTKRPYLHQDSGGFIKIGSTMARIPSISISTKNSLFMPFDEFNYISACDYNGRDVEWNVTRFKADNTIRVAFETVAVQPTCQMKWAVTIGSWGTAHALTFDLKSTDYVRSVRADRDFAKSQYETIGLKAFKDATAGVDMAVTVT